MLSRFESLDEFQLLVRAGDVPIPRIVFVEPLRLKRAHFVECIRRGERHLTDGHGSLRVVSTLEAAQRSLASHGAWVAVEGGE